ncbi:hypothetical protein KBB68_02260 [Candidatus Babeliales bacterium]|nr:hypothetical protein [Candidatus Babeliales bacterium]
MKKCMILGFMVFCSILKIDATGREGTVNVDNCNNGGRNGTVNVDNCNNGGRNGTVNPQPHR